MRKKRSESTFDANSYKRSFSEEHYDRVYLYVPKGQKSALLGRAKSHHLSLNGFILALIRHYLENDELLRDAVRAVEARDC